jgi:hypothetical protein
MTRTTVQPRYDYTGQQVLKVVGSSVSRYYGALFEASNDGYLTKHYVAAGLRIASQRVWAPGQFAAGAPDAAVQVASTSLHHAALVLVLRQDVQTGVALSVVVLGTGLRNPSGTIVRSVAGVLRLSAETLMLQAGVLDPQDLEESDVVREIRRDPHLTPRQREALVDVYEAFRIATRRGRNS